MPMKLILLLTALFFLVFNSESADQLSFTQIKGIQNLTKSDPIKNSTYFFSTHTNLSVSKNSSESDPNKQNPTKEEFAKKLINKFLKKLQHSSFEPKRDPSKKKDETASKTTKEKDKKAADESESPASNKDLKEKKSTISKVKKQKNKVNKASNSKGPSSSSKKTPSVEHVPHEKPCTLELKVEGVIGAATLDVLERSIYQVKKQNCSALLLLINTPGGQLLSTRKIVDRILNTDFPILCLIHPAGAHAGSAGAIIMQACHVNGGIKTTNIGAATPISGSGQELPKDLRKKMINDTTSWLDSLTQLRKRSKKFGQEIITEAKALSAQEAVKEGGIDFAGNTKQEFLEFAEGREVTVKNGEIDIVQVGNIIPFNLGFRYRLISLITEPEIIYILFTGSLFLLYFEITHPGLGAPGILGAIGLILSFVGMHKLDFSWAGLILLLLSMALFLAEVFISGFGIFGASGIVSFFLGSFLLFDPAKTGGVDIPISLILSVTAVFAILMGTITWLAVSTFKMKRKSNISDDFTDKEATPATIMQVNEDGVSGFALISGENWRFQSKTKVNKGDKVKVLSYKHLTLKVEPENSQGE